MCHVVIGAGSSGALSAMHVPVGTAWAGLLQQFMALSADYLSAAQSTIEQIAKRCENANDARCHDAIPIACLALMRCIHDASVPRALVEIQLRRTGSGNSSRRQMPALVGTILKA